MAAGHSVWESIPLGGLGEGWVELDENGWGALIGWAAGAENLRKGPTVDDSARTVTVTSTNKDGTVTQFAAAFTARDRQIVDEEASSYLADAGLERRGRAPLVHPAEMAPVMKQAMQRLYAGQE